MNIDSQPIVDQLVDLIRKGNAHATFEQAVENIPFNNVGIKPDNVPYNIWMLTEHARITQADIIDFSINRQYKELSWPGEYWPSHDVPKDESEWKKCLEQIFNDREQFIDLLKRPEVDLFTPFPHGNGQNLLREALLIADHNSYHIGQIVLIRRLLDDWHG